MLNISNSSFNKHTQHNVQLIELNWTLKFESISICLKLCKSKSNTFIFIYGRFFCVLHINEDHFQFNPIYKNIWVKIKIYNAYENILQIYKSNAKNSYICNKIIKINLKKLFLDINYNLQSMKKMENHLLH